MGRQKVSKEFKRQLSKLDKDPNNDNSKRFVEKRGYENNESYLSALKSSYKRYSHLIDWEL